LITFRYQKERAESSFVHRPVADVILLNRRHVLEAAMYIDSGADLTMLPMGAGLALGFHQRAGETIYEIRGVSGGGVPYLIRRIMIEMDGMRIPVRVAWALIEEVPFLLGRLDIFRRFEITFREAAGIITFEPLPLGGKRSLSSLARSRKQVRRHTRLLHLPEVLQKL
jgi:hypothetical protein